MTLGEDPDTKGKKANRPASVGRRRQETSQLQGEGEEDNDPSVTSGRLLIFSSQQIQ
jgi:hypothetical protein